MLKPPCTLHYIGTDDQLTDALASAHHASLAAERELDSILELRPCLTTRQKYRLIEVRRLISRRAVRVDKLEEESWWRTNHETLIEFYHGIGFELRFICWDQQFETYEEALSEANFRQTANSVYLEFGADDEGVRDLEDPQDMIRAAFVSVAKKETKGD